MFKKISLLILSAFLLLMLGNIGAIANNLYKIKDIKLDETAGNVKIYTNMPVSAQPKIIKMYSPDRIIFDFDNSILTCKRMSYNALNSAISNLTISQFTTNPNVVRVVFTLKSKNSGKDVNFLKASNFLEFKYKIQKTAENAGLKKNLVKMPKKVAKPVIKEKPVTKDKKITESKRTKAIAQTKSVKQLTLKQKKPINLYISENKQVAQISARKPIVKNDALKKNIPASTNDSGNEMAYGNILAKEISIIPVASINALPPVPVIEKANAQEEKPKPEIIQFKPAVTSITNISSVNNHLTITANGRLSVRKPFILETPKRLVYDISNAVIKSSNPIRLYSFINGDIVKVSQFNTNTVRITINSENTSNYRTLLSPDLNFLIIKQIQMQIPQKFVQKPVQKPVSTVKYEQIRPKQIVYARGYRFRVVLDAGHGGEDSGAQREGIMEKDITLSVAKKLEDDLTNSGVRVIMTRTADETVSLKARTDITNAEMPDVFVSVHVNSSEAPNAVGIETHWYTPQSKQLAQDIQDTLTGSVNSVNRGIINSRFYVIHRTDVPAVLVEIGFISNDVERGQLISEERQSITAKAICEGVLKFLNSRSIAYKAVEKEKNIRL